MAENTVNQEKGRDIGMPKRMPDEFFDCSQIELRRRLLYEAE